MKTKKETTTNKKRNSIKSSNFKNVIKHTITIPPTTLPELPTSLSNYMSSQYTLPMFVPVTIDFYNDTIMAAYDFSSKTTLVNFIDLLHTIGFSDSKSTRLLQKFKSDNVIKKYLREFIIPTLSKSSSHSVVYIENQKISIALAKINITPKMRTNETKLVQKLELYQDLLTETLNNIDVENIAHSLYFNGLFKKTLNAILDNQTNDMLSAIDGNADIILKQLKNSSLPNEKKAKTKKTSSKTSPWVSRMFPKYNMLISHFNLDNYKQLYSQLYKQFQNTYPGIDLDCIIKDYCSRNNTDNCFTQEAIEDNPEIRQLFENMIDGLLEKYNLCEKLVLKHQKTIFDD